MTESGRRAYLMARKAQLEAELKRETDNVRQTALKRRRLQLKEEIEKLA